MRLIRMGVFVGSVLSVAAGLHHWLWMRLVRDVELSAPWYLLATGLLVLLGLTLPLGTAARFIFGRRMTAPLLWTAYVWMGVVFFLVVLLGPAELIRWGWLEWGDPEAGSRLLLSRVIAGTSVGGALAMSAVALYQGLRRVGITRISVPLHGLPAELRGFKIVQLSDVHVGPTIGADFVEALVEQTNALEPDLIAITGDLVDGSVAQLGHLLTGLRGLRARHGVYFVTGNHEYYSGASAWVEHLSELGIRVLRNEAVSLDRGEVRLHLAGVDDWTAHQFPDGHGADIDAALDGVPAGEPVVLLAHQPRQFPSAAERGVALQLSGHTHGGQIFPFNVVVGAVEPFLRGLYRRGESWLYVSRGTGYWGPPMRLAVPAELTELVLAPA